MDPFTPELSSEASQTDRDLAIDDFATRWLGDQNLDLYKQMLLTVCRLARDRASRGDLKLIQKAFAELRYGLKTFAPFRSVRKISIFGSARTPEDHPDYLAAHEFARIMCDRGWMIITGAGGGIMKAGHGGAGPAASFGVAIRLPFEQQTNEIIAQDKKLVNFRYFFTRKVMFIKEASAVALFPGGFGTQDEGFEALTLVQTGKSEVIPIVMCDQPGGTYWSSWLKYVSDELLGSGMISEPDLALFRITHNVQDAAREVLDFYRVFHSSRYVNDDLVLRLQRPVGDAALERLNDEFGASMLSAGRIERTTPLPEENGELAELPRLKLRFNKKNFGVLRRFIDTLNTYAAGAEGAAGGAA